MAKKAPAKKPLAKSKPVAKAAKGSDKSKNRNRTAEVRSSILLGSTIK
jgi:hypothetical protein